MTRPTPLLDEKTPTGRSIVLEREVAGSPGAVYELFTTEEGVRGFFGPAANIAPEVGGPYEIIFDPESDPEGARLGTRGARVLALEPPSHLAFEWTMPPFASELNTAPLPTWVELHFTPVNGNPLRTRVRLEHHGFGEGGKWDEGFVYFGERAWPVVLDRLEAHLGRGESPPW